MKIFVNITTTNGELLERFAVLVDTANDPHGAAPDQDACKIRDLVERHFRVEDCE